MDEVGYDSINNVKDIFDEENLLVELNHELVEELKQTEKPNKVTSDKKVEIKKSKPKRAVKRKSTKLSARKKQKKSKAYVIDERNRIICLECGESFKHHSTFSAHKRLYAIGIFDIIFFARFN